VPIHIKTQCTICPCTHASADKDLRHRYVELYQRSWW